MTNNVHPLLQYRSYFSDKLEEFSIKKNEKMKHGIVHQRKCTDLFCSGVYGIFLAVGFILCFYSLFTGKMAYI